MRSVFLLALVCLATPALGRPRAKPTPLPSPPPGLSEQQLVEGGWKVAYYKPQDLGATPVVSAPSAVLMDFDTGEILYGKNVDTKRYPASTTKILTALLFAENTQPEDKVTCNNPYIQNVGESSLFIQPGDLFTSEALLYGFMLKSANDGGVVIAEHVAGSVPRFGELMNARAKELGAKNSNFVNPHGLHNSKHYTTARDLALIACEAMRNERFADAVSIPRRSITRTNAAGQPVVTIVQSKGKKAFYDVVPGSDGIKTGYTNPAKHCFVGSATRGGRRLIAVALAAPRNSCADCAAMIEWGFRRFPATALAQKGQSAGELPVRAGEKASVKVRAAANLRVAGDALGGRRVEKELIATNADAPIAKGQTVGQLVARVNGKELARIPLIADESVSRSVVKAVMRSGGAFLPIASMTVGVAAAGLALFTLGKGRPHRSSSSKSHRRRRNRSAP